MRNLESIGNNFQITGDNSNQVHIGANIGYSFKTNLENFISFNNTINGKSFLFSFPSFNGLLFVFLKYPIIKMWVEMWVIWLDNQIILLSKISHLLQIKSQPKTVLEEMLDTY